MLKFAFTAKHPFFSNPVTFSEYYLDGDNSSKIWIWIKRIHSASNEDELLGRYSYDYKLYYVSIRLGNWLLRKYVLEGDIAIVVCVQP